MCSRPISSGGGRQWPTLRRPPMQNSQRDFPSSCVAICHRAPRIRDFASSFASPHPWAAADAAGQAPDRDADANDPDLTDPEANPGEEADDWDDFEPNPQLDPPWPDWDAFDDEPPEPEEGDFWADFPDDDY